MKRFTFEKDSVLSDVGKLREDKGGEFVFYSDAQKEIYLGVTINENIT